jgi:hypothetical protein
MTEDERRRAREIYDEMMGVGRSATAPVSETGEEEAASSPPANCVYVFNGCAHPQFCRDGCTGKPL